MCLYLDSNFYQCFVKCKWEGQTKGRTETCGERNAVWQLGFARDILTLFPTGHLARVSQAFWRANSYTATSVRQETII